MRTRSILAVVAVPAITAVALLGATGAASAATTTHTADLTAAHATVPALGPVIAHTHQSGVVDTTSVSGTGTVPSDNGPVWAHDNMDRLVVVTPDKTTPGAWDVAFYEGGTYNAVANPITGATWHHTGPFGGWITYVVTSTGTPKAANLPATVPATWGHGDIMAKLFGTPVSHTGQQGDGSYSFTYYGIPGSPATGYVQNG